MTRMMKASFLFAAAMVVVACDSGTSTAAPAGKDAKVEAGATAAKDWTTVVVQTPEGGFRMGNPDAKVKLVEFASFTCGHCRDFHAEAEAKLKPTYVKTGLVSLEYRPFLLNLFDFTASNLAMCQGPDRFFTWANELYSNHEAWTAPFSQLTEADITPLRNLPLGQQVAGLAKAGKLNSFAAARGLPQAKFDECLGNEANTAALESRMRSAIDKYQIAGTPTFLINGKKVEGAGNWAQLEPKIKEAL